MHIDDYIVDKFCTLVKSVDIRRTDVGFSHEFEFYANASEEDCNLLKQLVLELSNKTISCELNEIVLRLITSAWNKQKCK